MVSLPFGEFLKQYFAPTNISLQRLSEYNTLRTVASQVMYNAAGAICDPVPPIEVDGKPFTITDYARGINEALNDVGVYLDPWCRKLAIYLRELSGQMAKEEPFEYRWDEAEASSFQKLWIAKTLLRMHLCIATHRDRLDANEIGREQWYATEPNAREFDVIVSNLFENYMTIGKMRGNLEISQSKVTFIVACAEVMCESRYAFKNEGSIKAAIGKFCEDLSPTT